MVKMNFLSKPVWKNFSDVKLCSFSLNKQGLGEISANVSHRRDNYYLTTLAAKDGKTLGTDSFGMYPEEKRMFDFDITTLPFFRGKFRLGELMRLISIMEMFENNLEFINETKNALDSGFNIIIFPTGTRTEENKELKLHKGASNLAVKCNKDIIPVYINCSRKFLAKGQKVYDAGQDIIDFDITINETIKIEEINGLNLTEIQKRNRINEIIKKRITKS